MPNQTEQNRMRASQQAIPPRPVPNTSQHASKLASGRGNLRNIIVYGGLVVAAMAIIFIIAGELITPKEPTVYHVKDYFTDFDQDGDIDHVLKADVVLNCNGTACSAIQPTKDVSSLYFPTDTPVAPGGQIDGGDPNVGGGAPPPTATPTPDPG